MSDQNNEEPVNGNGNEIEIVVAENPAGNEENETDSETLSEKCTRLEYQVSALKEVSNLRKRLYDIREKELDELKCKIRSFESDMDSGSNSRSELLKRVELTEKTSRELTDRLTESVKKFQDMRTTFEKKILYLQVTLEKTEEDFQLRTDELNGSELKNIELTSRVEELNGLLAENQQISTQMEEKYGKVCEQNQILTYQLSLLNSIFNDSNNSNDEEKFKAFGDIIRETQNLSNCPSTSTSSPGGSTSTANQGRMSADLAKVFENLEALDSNEPLENFTGSESCYKNVLGSGEKQVLSVSRTFLKLKNLILEKRSLQKEIDDLKCLNLQLESKVGKQERRLFSVTAELNKTWSLVQKLKVQHDELHNSEAVLRYELQEKRKQLQKLKVDLNSSREKWVKARAKNRQSEKMWLDMRAEFALRKKQDSQDSSGAFSDTSMSTTGLGESIPETEPEVVSSFEGSEALAGPAAPKTPENVEENIENPPGNLENLGDPDLDQIDSIEIAPERPETGTGIDEDQLVGLVNDVEDVEDIEELVADISIEIDDEDDDEVEDVDADDEEEQENHVGEGEDIRASRLQRLEEQSLLLHTQLMASSERNNHIVSRLAQLHSHYGSDQEAETEAGPSSPQPSSPSVDIDLDLSTTSCSSSQNPCPNSSPSPRELGRILLKQWPLRMEILRKEKDELRAESDKSQAKILECQQKLKIFENSQKILNQNLEEKEKTELELRSRICEEEKQIRDLQDNLHILNKEKERISNFFRAFKSEQEDLTRIKIKNSTKKVSKNCSKCSVRFSIFQPSRRKMNCGICQRIFCTPCISIVGTNQANFLPTTLRQNKGRHICPDCQSRRTFIESETREISTQIQVDN